MGREVSIVVKTLLPCKWVVIAGQAANRVVVQGVAPRHDHYRDNAYESARHLYCGEEWRVQGRSAVLMRRCSFVDGHCQCTKLWGIASG